MLVHMHVIGCQVGQVKKPRKGHPNAFRLDLAEKDRCAALALRRGFLFYGNGKIMKSARSAGENKYIISVEGAAEWMEALRQH